MLSRLESIVRGHVQGLVFDRRSASEDYSRYREIWIRNGAPDYVASGSYLEYHYARFCKTKELLLRSASLPVGPGLVDVGALGLVQSVLYAMDGFKVTAVEIDKWLDFAAPGIRAVAAEFGIGLVSYKDLSAPVELQAIPESSVDVLLFTEVLEHITFNPVDMWKEFYRILVPGGRVVVTTPSYYYVGHESWGWVEDLRRMAHGLGAGVSSRDVVGINSMGHHWRLYSRADLVEYFTALSTDFEVRNVCYFNYKPNQPEEDWRALARGVLQRLVPPSRESIFAEVVLKEKKSGIEAVPRW